MASDEFGDKTELPTEHRRQQERQRGHVARSSELTLSGHLLATSLIMLCFGAGLFEAIARFLASQLRSAADRPIDQATVMAQFQDIASWSQEFVLPWLMASLVAAVSINLVQVGFLFSTEKLGINVELLNPVTGLQRLFSMRSIVVLAVSTLKFAVLMGIAWWFIAGELPLLAALSDAPIGALCWTIGKSVVRLSLLLASVLIVIGAADYGYQRWKYEHEIMMTKDELKREIKEQEGDPQIRRRRHEAHKKLVASNNVRAVTMADFLTTNPTHVSIAFKYAPPKYPVPTVIAKGLDEVALRMREIAREHDIPIIERPELARRLYRELQVGDGIPVDLYDVFIEIMKYVYQITGKTLDVKID